MKKVFFILLIIIGFVNLIHSITSIDEMEQFMNELERFVNKHEKIHGNSEAEAETDIVKNRNRIEVNDSTISTLKKEYVERSNHIINIANNEAQNTYNTKIHVTKTFDPTHAAHSHSAVDISLKLPNGKQLSESEAINFAKQLANKLGSKYVVVYEKKKGNKVYHINFTPGYQSEEIYKPKSKATGAHIHIQITKPEREKEYKQRLEALKMEEKKRIERERKENHGAKGEILM